MDLEPCNNTFDVARGCNSAPLATVSQTEIKASFAISIEKKLSLPSLNDVETWLNENKIKEDAYKIDHEFSESIEHNQIIIKAMRQKLNDLWLEGRIKKTISFNDLMLITDYLNNIELLPNNQYSDIILGIYLKEIQNENVTT